MLDKLPSFGMLLRKTGHLSSDLYQKASPDPTPLPSKCLNELNREAGRNIAY